jgi:hypothetical protein
MMMMILLRRLSILHLRRLSVHHVHRLLMLLMLLLIHS